MKTNLTNERWVESLYRDEYSNLVTFINKRVQDEEVAQELVQITFQRLWENVNYLIKHPNIHAWLRMVLKNELINYWRKINVHQKYVVSYEHTDVLNANVPSPEDNYCELSVAQILDTAKKILTKEQYRHLVRLTLDKVGHAAVAKEVGITIETSQKRLERIRSTIKKHFQ